MSAPDCGGCTSCGGEPASLMLGGEGPLCDRCFDDRLVETGWPRLPDAPPPVAIPDADGTLHTMIYRLYRGPAGISVRLVERGRTFESGYGFEEFGDHNADPRLLLDLVTVHAETEMARRYLTRDDAGRLQVAQEEGRPVCEVVGQIVTVEPFGPLTVIVDGRAVRWDELGQALSTFEGWQFVLRLADPAGDPRE